LAIGPASAGEGRSVDSFYGFRPETSQPLSVAHLHSLEIKEVGT